MTTKTVDEYEFVDIADQKHELVLQQDDHGRWEVSCFVDEEHSWTVSHNPDLGEENPRSRQPFTEEEARKEFERWRPSS
jgi:hypothetical protein